MKTTTLILVIALVLAALILGWIFLTSPAVPLPVAEQVLKPSDAVEELQEGTTITDIEQDLEVLSQEERLLGDLEEEVSRMEQELQFEGL